VVQVALSFCAFFRGRRLPDGFGLMVAPLLTIVPLVGFFSREKSHYTFPLFIRVVECVDS
jgi:hypothetical protein